MQLKSSIKIGNSPMTTMIRKYSYLKIVPEQATNSARDYTRGFSSTNSYLSLHQDAKGSYINSSPNYDFKSPQKSVSNITVTNEYRLPANGIRGTHALPAFTRESKTETPDSYIQNTTERISIRSMDDDSAAMKPTAAIQSGGSESSRNAGLNYKGGSKVEPQEVDKKLVPSLNNLPAQPGSGSSDQHYEKILSQIVTLAKDENKGAAMTYLKSLITSADSFRSHSNVSSPNIEHQEEIFRIKEELARAKDELTMTSEKYEAKMLELSVAKEETLRLNNELEAYRGKTGSFEEAKEQLEINLGGLQNRISELVGQLDNKSDMYNDEISDLKKTHNTQISQLQATLAEFERKHNKYIEKGDPVKLEMESNLRDLETNVKDLTSKNEYLQSQ